MRYLLTTQLSQKGRNIGAYMRVMRFGLVEALRNYYRRALWGLGLINNKRNYDGYGLYKKMVVLVFHYLLMTLKCLERSEELVTQRHEGIRCAKLLLCGIKAKTSQLMGVVSCTVENQQGLKLMQDAKLFAKATEEELRLDKLLLVSKSRINPCFW
jgi:hypothetical protein